MAERRRGWLAPALRRQSIVAAVASGLITASALAGLRFGMGLQICVLLAGITVIGFPHGAFDHLVAKPLLAPVLGAAWPAVFATFYFGLAALVMAAWSWAPGWTLAGFLAMSVLHFGLGDLEELTWPPVGLDRAARVLLYGTLPILLPVAFHPAEAAPVLAALGNVDPVTMAVVMSRLIWLVPVWGVGFIWSLACADQKESLALRIISAASFVVVPPLLAFAVYFCLGHSVRHVLRLANWHDAGLPWAAARWAAQVLVPASVFCALGLALLALADQDTLRGVLVPAFRVIAALTLPHMIVTAYLTPPAER